jgi:hypothetical protein
MGNHAFFGRNTNNLPRVKRFKTVFLIEPSFENASALKFAKMWTAFTNGFWYFIWKTNGESHPKHAFIPQYSRYNSEQSTQLLVCIMKLQLKTD